MNHLDGKTSIPNVELLKKAYLLYKNSGVEFMHINAHTGRQDVHSLGNEQADKLAVLAIDNKLNKTNSKISIKNNIFDARIYLNVPYAEKEHAKSLGAKWDPKNKKWYSMKLNNNLNELVKYY